MLDPATRSQFLMPEGSYFLSHSVGCLPLAARLALETHYFAPWARHGGEAWPGWLAALDRFRAAVATLIGAEADDICPQSNVSAGFASILQALPMRPGRRRIVLCEEDFPSLGFVATAAARLGYALSFLPVGSASEDPATWERVLGEDVQLALVTHAFSNRSARLPVGAITAITRRLGIYSVVDAVQTLGVVPIDIADWDADFLLGSSVKFLCGGPGAAFLWGRRETVRACAPIDTGWFSHEDPFAFDIHDYRPRADAGRFLGGTPSIAPFVVAEAAVRMLLEIGVARIFDHNQALIDAVIARVGSARIASVVPRNARGNAVLIRTGETKRVATLLGEANIHVDTRDGCIRVSPHCYTHIDDVARLANTLERS